MKMNEPELDPNLGIEANYHSPFGPKFLDFFLKGPIREKLKEIVNHHRAANPPIEGLAQIRDEPWTCGLAAGRLEHISKKIDDEEFDGFAGNTVSKLIKAYVTNYIELSDAQKENGITHDQLFSYFPTAIWWNALSNGDFWMLHDHKDETIEMISTSSHGNLSGNIYLEVPKELEYPQGWITWYFGGNKENMSKHNYTLRPEEGKVYMWPSWVEHSVNPINNFHTEDNRGRICLSFNGYWKKRTEKDAPAPK